MSEAMGTTANDTTSQSDTGALASFIGDQLGNLDVSNPAAIVPPTITIQQVMVPESLSLCVTVNAPDGTRHPLSLDAMGTRVSTDKALCEAVRDTALTLRPTCAAVIEWVDEDAKRIYGL